MRVKRKYFDFLDQLKEKEATGGPDVIPDLLGKFPELNRLTAMDLYIRWTLREAVK